MDTPITGTGLHLLAEITTHVQGLLNNQEACEDALLPIISKGGFTVVGRSGYIFPNHGFTSIFALAESHFSIHTWPELGYVTLDLFTCNVSRDNSTNAKIAFDSILEIFQPETIIKREIKR